MNKLTSVALTLAIGCISTSAMAERPDFSKTAAARADYDFSKNVSAAMNSNDIKPVSTRHDFSKTLAATSGYDFSKNPQVEPVKHTHPSSRHDFSKTEALLDGSL
ncbi:hypothetical protein L2719_05250 [Shewanella schlegeliana]|uniref:Uncharacterized protein n=1 Tax=Shewanella schlegeliana TaxID=190308 RepID=A0ABS1SY60_9GAMM|nr:hypothetical protein [Shewanella schlegeliana]MBL4912950.1 hypothetical protein [Shewanella schlegeliana]MCL1108954.1 hypothetical protein [Shewanella schlegeliana]GIU23566.1 hypothetical protein TUM4433_06220 [Shewanella schlegeliana]